MARGAETTEAQITALTARATALEAGSSEALATTTAPGVMPAALFAAHAPPVASVTALAAIAAGARADGMVCLVQSDQAGNASLWQFSAASAATDASKNLVVAPSAGTGAWLRMPGPCALSLPFTFATADAAVLWTCPTGARFRVREAWWDIAVTLAGGSSSAIGVHCSVSGWSTKGDILGGAGGDVAATLVSTNLRMSGTVGAKLDAHTHDRLIMVAADTLLFDQIVSAFTSGSGNVRVLGDLITNPGA